MIIIRRGSGVFCYGKRVQWSIVERTSVVELWCCNGSIFLWKKLYITGLDNKKF